MMPIQDMLESYCGVSHPLMLKLHGGKVLRYHQTGMGVTQTVAEHTWRVLVILLHIFPDASSQLIKTTIYHDVPEGFLGDIPAPVKRNPLLREALDAMEAEFTSILEIPPESALSKQDYARLKCADYLELCDFCKTVGTPRARQVYEIGRGYVRQVSPEFTDAEHNRIADFYVSMERWTW